jgi:hypothetical protein
MELERPAVTHVNTESSFRAHDELNFLQRIFQKWFTGTPSAKTAVKAKPHVAHSSSSPRDRKNSLHSNNPNHRKRRSNHQRQNRKPQKPKTMSQDQE